MLLRDGFHRFSRLICNRACTGLWKPAHSGVCAGVDETDHSIAFPGKPLAFLHAWLSISGNRRWRYEKLGNPQGYMSHTWIPGVFALSGS